jgi:hypothetical protein
MRRCFIGWSLLLLVSLASAQDTLRVLFIGNSHTYTNSLPTLLRQLAAGGGHVLETGMSAPGGYTLRQHVTHAATLTAIQQGDWDWVALQEQSQVPVIPYWRQAWMVPAAVSLDSLIRQNREHTLLFMTWGWRDGGLQCIEDSCAEYRDFQHMQDSMSTSYRRLAVQLECPVVPVGDIFRRVIDEDPFADLWNPDGYHPSLEGSYLAACSFYVQLYGESPVGLPHPIDIPQDRALWLQGLVAEELGLEEESAPRPRSISLVEAWPNPFNPSLDLACLLPRAGHVRVEVRNLQGQRVALLQDGPRGAGRQLFRWQSADVASGIYQVHVSLDGSVVGGRCVTLLH